MKVRLSKRDLAVLFVLTFNMKHVRGKTELTEPVCTFITAPTFIFNDRHRACCPWYLEDQSYILFVCVHQTVYCVAHEIGVRVFIEHTHLASGPDNTA